MNGATFSVPGRARRGAGGVRCGNRARAWDSRSLADASNVCVCPVRSSAGDSLSLVRAAAAGGHADAAIVSLGLSLDKL